MRFARDADANAASDFAGLVIIAREPQRVFAAKIEPIEPAIDLQRLGEPSRTARQVAYAFDAAIGVHETPGAIEWA